MPTEEKDYTRFTLGCFALILAAIAVYLFANKPKPQEVTKDAIISQTDSLLVKIQAQQDSIRLAYNTIVEFKKQDSIQDVIVRNQLNQINKNVKAKIDSLNFVIGDLPHFDFLGAE